MTSGRRVFQQHTERTEGSDTTPRLAHSESTERRVYKPQLRQKRKDHAAQRGRDACGTATRISASLSRRLSAFFESTSGQGSKAAKFAVLTPGPGMFVNVQLVSRVMIASPSETPPVSLCVCRCVRSCWRRRVCVPAFDCESERGPFVGEVEKRDERWSEIEFEAAALTDFSLLLVLRVHSEPGNVCI